MNMEIWKDVFSYEGLYQVSNIGNVRSLDRAILRNVIHKVFYKGKLLKYGISTVDYHIVILSKNGNTKTKQTHQLVAESFLGHKPCGYKLVVNHKDFNKHNNSVHNLEIVTARENTSHRKKEGKSKYTGVIKNNRCSTWRSAIRINGTSKHLGSFKSEIEASIAYQKELKKIL